MQLDFPTVETLLLEHKEHVLFITLNRPKVRNAMSLQMVREIMSVFESIKEHRQIRAVVLRGAEGHFCAGGDIKDMANARAAMAQKDQKQEPADPFQALNREFGRMITQVNRAPQVVIAILEGAILGGGFGLACISDVALATDSAKFGLPETGLGIPPAQIAPFVVDRIGLTQARRIALLGMRFGAEEALRMGLIHEHIGSLELLDERLQEILTSVKRCAPHANVVTKDLLLSVDEVPLETLLDNAAESFSQAVQGQEGQEGAMAFIQKRPPFWSV